MKRSVDTSGFATNDFNFGVNNQTFFNLSVFLHIQLEEEMRGRVEEWEKNKGSSFLVHGQRIMDYISSQWEEHRLQKDKEKNERASFTLWVFKISDGVQFGSTYRVTYITNLDDFLLSR